MTKEFEEIGVPESQESDKKSKLGIIIERVKNNVVKILWTGIKDAKMLMKNDDFKYILDLLGKILTKIEDWRLDWKKERDLRKYKKALNLILKEVFGNEQMKNLIIEKFGEDKLLKFKALLKIIFETWEWFIDKDIFEIMEKFFPQKKSKSKKTGNDTKPKKIDLWYGNYEDYISKPRKEELAWIEGLEEKLRRNKANFKKKKK